MCGRSGGLQVDMPDDKIRNMEQFAAVSGLSRPTLSKYFHDPESVRISTRARIEKALEQYDYRPNIFAVNQNRKLTKNVGIIVPYLADPFFAEIARNIEQRCIDAGYRPTLYSAHGDPALEVDILDGLRALKPAGVLLAPLGRVSDKSFVEKFCADVPTVMFDSSSLDFGLAFVGSDSPQFAAQSVEYLNNTGAAPCFLEMATPANPNANKRRQGYIAGMEALGLAPQIVQVPGEGWDFEEVGQREGMRALDEGRITSDTVLCSNDRLAIGFLAACYSKGMRVGKGEGCDIRVAGLDDHPFSRFTCPPLTTVAQNYDAISRSAVEILFRAIEGEEAPRQTILFEGRLVVRDSA